MITGAKMTLGASSKKKKSVLLGLLIQIWPGLVSSKCCDYLKVCAILGAVAKLTLVLAEVSPFLMLSGSKCSVCLFWCVPSRNLPHFLYYTSDTGDMGLTDSAFRLLPAHCCRPYSPLQPGHQQWYLPHAEAAASPFLFPFPASPRLCWVWDVIMCRANCQNHKKCWWQIHIDLGNNSWATQFSMRSPAFAAVLAQDLEWGILCPLDEEGLRNWGWEVMANRAGFVTWALLAVLLCPRALLGEGGGRRQERWLLEAAVHYGSPAAGEAQK